MSYLSSNIRYLRKACEWTQAVLAKNLGLTRAQIGSYEEERADPKITTLQNLSALFKRSIDDLVSLDLTKGMGTDYEGKALRILPILVGDDDKEQIAIVPVHAQAGYLHGYGDTEFIEELPRFGLPLKELPSDGSYRLFQIAGDSMLPIKPGSYIISKYLQDWTDIKDGSCYLLVTQDEGIVYKRVWKQEEKNSLLLKSDNPLYPPYELGLEQLGEVWQARGIIDFELPSGDEEKQILHQLSSIIIDLKKDVDSLKRKIN